MEQVLKAVWIQTGPMSMAQQVKSGSSQWFTPDNLRLTPAAHMNRKERTVFPHSLPPVSVFCLCLCFFHNKIKRFQTQACLALKYVCVFCCFFTIGPSKVIWKTSCKQESGAWCPRLAFSIVCANLQPWVPQCFLITLHSIMFFTLSFRINKNPLVIDQRMCVFLSLIASNPLNPH